MLLVCRRLIRLSPCLDHRHLLFDRGQIIRAVDASKFTVPENYWAQYKRARLTFRHHIIYDPKAEVGHIKPRTTARSVRMSYLRLRFKHELYAEFTSALQKSRGLLQAALVRSAKCVEAIKRST